MKTLLLISKLLFVFSSLSHSLKSETQPHPLTETVKAKLLDYKTVYINNDTTSIKSLTANPAPVLSSTLTASPICSGSIFSYTATSVTTNTTFSWTRAAVSGISNSAGSGATATITETLINTTSSPIVVTYAITLTANGSSNTQNVTLTVNSLPDNTSTGFSSSSFCYGSQATITFNANNGSGKPPYILTYQNDSNIGTYLTASIANDSPITFSINPNPTTNTHYTLLSISDANGCINLTPTDATAQVTINTLPVISFTSQPGTTICAGSTVTYTTQSGMNNYVWGFPGTSNTDYVITSGGTSSSNTVTLKYLTTGNKTITVNYNNANSCSATISATSITTMINASPVAPSTGLVTQPNCNSTLGSIVLNDLPTGNWTINPGNIKASVSSIIIEKLTAGTYNYTVTNDLGCTSVASNTVVIFDSTSKTWTSSGDNDWFNKDNWTPHEIPSSSDCITIPSNSPSILIPSSSIAYANSLTLLNKSSLNVKGTLIVSDVITVDSSATMILDNNANLIQTNPVTNSGIITVIRSSTPAVWADYTYWSSPTSGNQTLFDFSPNSNPKYFLNYDNQWNYAYPKITTFSKGIGYAIMAPINAITTPQIFTYRFTGTPNNGNINVPVIQRATSFNKLIGNPYPSALDADKFIKANNATNGTLNKTISGTLYFWTHNTQSGNTDYTTYNLTGSVPTEKNNNTSSQWIASGQGFVVEITNNDQYITFNNDMRVGTTDLNNTHFYRKPTISSVESELEKNRIWLNLSHQSQFVNQILVGYIETASNNYDPNFDGKNISTSKTGLYSLLENTPMTIQAKAIPFNDNDKVVLGFKTETSGNYSINLSDFDGFFTTNQGIYLEDTYLNSIQNLKNKPYDFTTDAGVFDDRFVLRYTDQTLGLKTIMRNSNSLNFLTKDHNLNIKSNNTLIQELNIFSVTGQLLYSKKDINDLEINISNLNDHQVYIAKVKMWDGSIENRKIIF